MKTARWSSSTAARRWAFWSSYGSYGIPERRYGRLHVDRLRPRSARLRAQSYCGAGADTAQQHVQSHAAGQQRATTSPMPVNAKTIITWGGNPAEAYVHAWQYVCQAREKGAKLITIDPQFTASAAHSDIYVPVTPRHRRRHDAGHGQLHHRERLGGRGVHEKQHGVSVPGEGGRHLPAHERLRRCPPRKAR